MHKDHEDVFWSWVIRGPVPVGESRSRSSSSSNSSTSGGKRKLGETDPLKTTALQLGTRMMVIAGTHPSEFRDMVQRMAALEGNEAQEIEVSSSSSASSSGSTRPTNTKDRGPADRRQEEAKSGTATDADSVGASGSTANRISQKDQSSQAYEARRDCMFGRLGTERASAGDDAARAVSAQPSGIVDRDPYLGQAAPCFQAAAHWCRGVTVLNKYDRPMKECAMQRRGGCDRPHDQESCRRLWTQNSERGARFRQQLEDYSPWSENFLICEYGCAVPRTHFPGRDGHETWPRPQGCLKGQFWALG